MNRMITRIVTLAALAGAVAVGAQGVALAAENHGEHAKHRRAHGEGLVGEAMKLDSLTPEQRTSIEQLVQERKSAAVPARAADAQVLTQLAHQVEQASVDSVGLESSLGVERTAVSAERAADRDALVRLHAILTPAQRAQLVDKIEAASAGWAEKREAREQKEKTAQGDKGEKREGRGGKLGLSAEQRAQIKANLVSERTPKTADQIKAEREAHKAALESFRGDSFDPTPLVRVEVRGERAEKMAKAVVPVLSPAQRATYASQLRSQAAHETR
jgi:Spy/CpxP family protein refolding chaperone